jgi:prevent-host-death family protein
MKSFSLSELNRHPGEIVDAALAEPVALTKHGKRKLVVMDAVTYDILKHGKAFRLEDAPEAVHNELMEAPDSIIQR